MVAQTSISLKKKTEKVAGAGGFEPPNAGSKSRCLTAWRRPNVFVRLLILQSKSTIISLSKLCLIPRPKVAKELKNLSNS